MDELLRLRALWSQRIKRTSNLILVPKVTYDALAQQGSLHNDAWGFVVPYAFRDALDIAYVERMVNKKPQMMWTQGARIRFKEGDTLFSRDGRRFVQVKSAQRMGWDTAVNSMYEGSVVFAEYELIGGAARPIGEFNCTQMEFLELLMRGSCPAAYRIAMKTSANCGSEDLSG